MLIGIIFLFLSTNIYSQGNYYSGTDGLNGTKLKSVLYSKIKNHIRFPYTSGSTDVWDILKETDKAPNNSSNVILIYTDKSVNANQEYNNGNGWNREHIWAKSHGFPDESDTAYTDVHHLRPSDINANSTRGNKDFDYGGSSLYEKENHYDADSWEPRDEIKGDIARMMLYMSVRYEGGDGYDLELVDYVPSSGANFGKKSVLLEWNRLDPVSTFERNRNRTIYKYQKNYNPFVDHPEFADRIYNSDKLILEQAEQIGNNLILSFSKELNITNAEKVENYKVENFSDPILATPNFGGDSKKVVLSFEEIFLDTFYNVRVSNLLSSTGETILPNSIALFIADTSTQLDSVAPSVPTNLTATTDYSGLSVELTWNQNPESDLSHYNIYRGAVQNFTPGVYSLIGTTNNNYFTDSEVLDYRYYYKISAVDKSGNVSDYSEEASVLVGVENIKAKPEEFSLSQNYPNPFNPSTTINYSIPVASTTMTQLKVYNILGMEVATLVNEMKSAGNYSIEFDATKFTSGVYLYTLYSGKNI